MGLITVKEYAKGLDTSVQSVYQRIATGSLEVELVDGVKMIRVADKPKASKDCTKSKAKVQMLKGEVKALKRELALVVESDKKSYDHLEKMFNMLLQLKQVDTPVLEAKIVKKKKKKSKR